MFKAIWNDTLGFFYHVWQWVEKEAELFWANGGSVVFNDILQLGEQAFTAWVATQPTSAIFADFESFAVSYIKANWKNDLVIIEDAVVKFVLGSIGIKYQIPSSPSANGGTLIGGTETVTP